MEWDEKNRGKLWKSAYNFSIADEMSYKKDKEMTRPLSSRHFLWTPVMQHKHNGLPSGFVLS